MSKIRKGYGSMPIFVGLDLEMTGTDITKHEPCQIGAASANGGVFCLDVRCTLEQADPEAMAVHGIDPGWLREGAPEVGAVDHQLAFWLTQELTRGRSVVPVGWGVSYFDMPWVRKYFPKASKYLSRRSVELGAVCYTIGATFGMSPDTLKRKSKRYAEEKVTDPHVWHNAGFDAEAALYCWEYLMKVMKAGEYVEQS
jgi:DNA polymerase III epsilon subunit-like protein